MAGDGYKLSRGYVDSYIVVGCGLMMVVGDTYVTCGYQRVY